MAQLQLVSKSSRVGMPKNFTTEFLYDHEKVSMDHYYAPLMGDFREVQCVIYVGKFEVQLKHSRAHFKMPKVCNDRS